MFLGLCAGWHVLCVSVGAVETVIPVLANTVLATVEELWEDDYRSMKITLPTQRA